MSFGAASERSLTKGLAACDSNSYARTCIFSGESTYLQWFIGEKAILTQVFRRRAALQYMGKIKSSRRLRKISKKAYIYLRLYMVRLKTTDSPVKK